MVVRLYGHERLCRSRSCLETIDPSRRRREALGQLAEVLTHIGQDLEVEVRYRRFDGAYRRQLVRVLSQRNGHGDIVRWHGACAGFYDPFMTRIAASHRKQQMIALRCHAEVNLFGFNSNTEVMMLEGSVK